MKTKIVCEQDLCTGCMACISICSKKAITIKDNIMSYNAVINSDLCINCGKCIRVCPNNNECVRYKTIEFWQGWANDDKIRKFSSSGGAATEIMKNFIERKSGVVFACRYNQGEFEYAMVSSVEEIKNFAKSKYIKSNPGNVYHTIKALLISGSQVLFIGLPCHVAGVRNFIGEKLENSLYTIDLICHGTPSPKVLAKVLNENGIELSGVNDIKFREGSSLYLQINGKPLIADKIMDSYSMAFMYALSYTEGCYHCKYAALDRVSDITLGDSWGSQLEEEDIKKGISLILCQTDKGKELLKISEINLKNVDINRALQFNKQLCSPSHKPQKRDKILEAVKENKNFSKQVFWVMPQKSIKQNLKLLLFKLGIIK